MAIRRMNEMWRRLALYSVLSVLLLQGCQGENTTVTEQPQRATTAFIDTKLWSTINPKTVIQTDSDANTALPMTTDSTSVTVKTTSPAPVTNHAKNENINATSVSPPENQSSPANTESTEKSDNLTVSSNDNNTEIKESKEEVFLQSGNLSNNSINNMSEYVTTKSNKYIQDRNNSKTNVPKYDVTTKSIQDSNNPDNNSKSEVNVVENASKDSSKSSSVLVSVLLSGLALAAVVIGVYVKKNHCHTKGNSMKLTEESDHADEENQGNTLVSVAPLNPPEDQEKPNQNGESLEAVKIQNPPAATNGHSATKADTEF